MREKIATSLLKPLNPSLIIVLGAYTVVWGIWIMNPFTDVFSTAAIFSVMAKLANEYVWGLIAVSSGLTIIRGALKPSYPNLQLGSFVGFFHWFVIAIMYLIGDVVNTGGITSLTFAIYCAIVWVNIKVNRTLYPQRLD